MVTYSLFTDGASRGNPGQSAVGVIAFSSSSSIPALEKPIFKFGKYIGIKTNNEAEYASLIFGIELCLKYKILCCSVFMDSQLVVYQMQGRYKVKKIHLKKLYFQAKELEQKMTKISYVYINRDKNYIADELANQALDEYCRR